MKEEKARGLKQMRGASLNELGIPVRSKTPDYACSNCKCNRYSVCTCMIKKGKKDEQADV